MVQGRWWLSVIKVSHILNVALYEECSLSNAGLNRRATAYCEADNICILSV